MLVCFQFIRMITSGQECEPWGSNSPKAALVTIAAFTNLKDFIS
jgi:hypothetical protein